jgi:hypothetical protein
MGISDDKSTKERVVVVNDIAPCYGSFILQCVAEHENCAVLLDVLDIVSTNLVK